jgi:phospholipid/cholesterol/gamma-HCH transport system substrate-binding protein
MKYITKEVRIGIAGIAALCILVYGINYLKGIHMFKPSSYFYVKFHNVNGLTKSSPVFADGFRVGIVRDLYYDYTQPGKVVAEIDVNTDLRIPKGSTAELATEMLGGVKMNLLLANNPREKYQVGDTIPGTLNNGMMEKVAIAKGRALGEDARDSIPELHLSERSKRVAGFRQERIYQRITQYLLPLDDLP